MFYKSLQSSMSFFLEFSIKIELFCFKVSQKLLEKKIIRNFHKNVLFWKVSTLICFVEKIPHYFTLLLNFLKIVLICNIYTKMTCLKISTEIFFLWKFSQKCTSGENFQKNLLCLKSCFVGCFPLKFALLKKNLYWKQHHLQRVSKIYYIYKWWIKNKPKKCSLLLISGFEIPVSHNLKLV